MHPELRNELCPDARRSDKQNRASSLDFVPDAIGFEIASIRGLRSRGVGRECLRRLEIPEAMQKKYGFAPLGDALGPVKTAIFGGNNARLYGVNAKKAMLD